MDAKSASAPPKSAAAAQPALTASAADAATTPVSTPKTPPGGLAAPSAQSASDSAAKPKTLQEAAKLAEKSLGRLSIVDHKEERSGVAIAVGEGGLWLTHAPLLAGAYEARCLLPGSRQKTAPFNRCAAWSPESNLALVRAGDPTEPVPPLPPSEKLPGKGDRLVVMYDMGQLDLDRSDVTVAALLSTSDLEKKLQRNCRNTAMRSGSRPTD